MKESELGKKLLVAASQLGLRLFRNNTGTGWTGKILRFSRLQQVLVKPGDVLISGARPLHAGLCVGSSDYIGWKTVTIGPDMVGQKVAIFVGWELKTERGNATEAQKNFAHAVIRAGGLGVISYGEADTWKALEEIDAVK